MKVQVISVTLFIIVSISCNKATETDINEIADPHARWQAYNQSSYSIYQTSFCFCIHGGVLMKVVVKENKIIDVVDTSKGISLPQNQWSWYKTVDELFLIIARVNKDSVAYFRAEYDRRFGYPISFYVDPSALIADEEYGFDTKNLTLIH